MIKMKTVPIKCKFQSKRQMYQEAIKAEPFHKLSYFYSKCFYNGLNGYQGKVEFYVYSRLVALWDRVAYAKLSYGVEK